MKILITGICGFVGSTLARSWLEAEPRLTIFGLDNFSRPGSEDNRIRLQKLGIKLFHSDIRMASDLETLPVVDWVIDAAANPNVLAGIDGQSSSRQLIEHNLLGTVNLLEYCKRVAAGFIMLSTSRVYAINPLSELKVEPHNNAFCLSFNQQLPAGLTAAGVNEAFSTRPPVSLYGSSKLASETLALEYGETFGFPVWINRCGVMAGAGQFGRPDQGLLAYWLNAWLRNRSLAYIGFDGQGYQVRDFLHPSDLLPLLRKQTEFAIECPEKVINLGGGASHAMSLAQISAWCRDRWGKREVYACAEMRRYDIPWLVMDSSLAYEKWGWQPITTCANILEEIADHAENHPEWLELSGNVT